MLLTSELAPHQMIPKEYTLDITQETAKNTFVFTEQDLPGFKSKSKQKFDPTSANIPARLNRGRIEKPGKQPWDPNKKFQPFFRKAIPKRTILAGRVAHEVNCTAVDTEESKRLLILRATEGMRPKSGTKFLKEDVSGVGSGFIQPGSVAASNTFGKFIVRQRVFRRDFPQANVSRKPKEQALGTDRNLAKLLVCLRMSCWTRSLKPSKSSTTGQ